MTVFSLLLVTCDVALARFMVDSDKTAAKRPCYRMGLGREAAEGRFLGKINKYINKSVVMGRLSIGSASEQGNESEAVTLLSAVWRSHHSGSSKGKPVKVRVDESFGALRNWGLI